MTGALVVTSLTVWLGGWLVWSGRAGRPVPVERAIERIHRPAPTSTSAADGVAGIVGHRLAATMRPPAAWTRPLRLVGRSPEVHVGVLALAALAGLVAPTLVLGSARVVGLIGVDVWIPAAVSLLAALVIPAIVHANTLARAEEVELDLRHQVGAYLDMVTMLLAGNVGHEGALDQAARAGDGLLFRELRRRMREVGTTGRSLVDALDATAHDLGLVELEQVAATVSLSAAEGAPVARTLNAKCATLRSTIAAEQEAAARIRTDKVTPPLVGMAVLFMALIVYPALDLA